MRNEIVIEKMLIIIEKIQKYCAGLDYSSFSQNDMVIEASVFNISQLGEISNKSMKVLKKNIRRFHGDSFMDCVTELFMIMRA